MSNSLRARISKLGYKGLLSEKDVKRIRDALLNEMKYRWHDLRKNPDDLPREEGLYAVCLKYDTELSEIGFGQYENMYGYSDGWTATMPSFGKVIAWREIEPFEEEK